MSSRIRNVLVGTLLWCACSSANATLNVLACEPEWKALAEALGGDRIEVVSATNAFQDPHHIEARPSLILKARDADIVFCTGADLEVGWLPLLLKKSANRRIQVGEPGHFMAADQVMLIEKPDTVDRSHGDIHADGNPHVHLDPNRLLQIGEAFSQRLQVIDAKHAKDYQRMFDAFSTRWRALIEDWESQADVLQGKHAVVYHKNWSYLLNWLQIDTVGDLEPKPGIPPTSSHLNELLLSVEKQPAAFILIANYQNSKGSDWLSDRSGIPVLELPFTVGGNESATDLPGLYQSIVSTLLGSL